MRLKIIFSSGLIKAKLIENAEMGKCGYMIMSRETKGTDKGRNYNGCCISGSLAVPYIHKWPRKESKYRMKKKCCWWDITQGIQLSNWLQKITGGFHDTEWLDSKTADEIQGQYMQRDAHGETHP